MSTFTKTEAAYTYRDKGPYPFQSAQDGVSDLEALRAYIARSMEYGNDPADYGIVVRTVTTTTTEWVPA